MVVLGALKVVRLRLVPLERLLARTNKQQAPAVAGNGTAVG
jgi:hypothetical protein